MKEPSRTNQELLDENSLLVQRIQELEHADAKRREAEEAIFDSNSLLKLIVNTIPQSIFWKDSDGRYLGCNTVFAEAAGIYDLNLIIGKTDFDLPWPEKEAEAYRADDRQVIESGRPKLHIIEPLQQADGTRLLIDTSKVPLCDAAGRPFGVLGVYEDITERKQTEDALRESEDVFNQFMSYSPPLVYIKDEKLRLIKMSGGFEELLGKPVSELLGKDSYEHLPPEFVKSAIADDLKVLKEGIAVEAEETLNGRVYSTIKFPIHRESGKPNLIGGFSVDITERKQAEESLRQSVEKFTKAFQTSQNAVIITRAADGQFIEVNDAFTSITDYEREEALTNSSIGLNLWVHEEDRQQVVADLRAGHIVTDREFLFRTKSGKTITGLFSAQIINLSIGLCVLSSIIDITERKKAEEISKQEQALSNAIIEAIPGTFYMLDEIGQYVRWNAYQRDEIVGKPDHLVGSTNALDTIHPDDRELIQSKIVNVLANGVDETIEGRVLLRGGPAFRWLLMTGRRMLIDDHPFLVGIGIDITERKQAEEDLRESEEKFRSITEQTSDLIAITDARGFVTYASSASEKLFQFAPEEMYDRNFIEFLDEPDIPRALALFSEALKGDFWKHAVELSMKRKDGSIFIGELKGSKFRQGLMNGTLVVIRDITERKRTENALRQSETTLRAILDAAPFPVAMVDLQDDKIYFWSHSANLLFGHTAATASEWYELAYPDPEYRKEAIDRWKTLLEKARSSGQAVNTGEYRVSCRNGKVRICELHAAFLTNYLIVTFNDITERKQAEVTLANEKERLAVTLRSIGDGVITTDIHCNVVIMNKVAEELTGWKQNEAQGKPITAIFNIINEGTRLPCENPARKVLSTGQIIELANHTLLISRDGSELVIADSGAPIKDQNSVTIGVVLVFRDMTEKQKLLDVIQRTDKLDSLGVLAGGIAHDFNNMLAGMFGYIDLARASSTDKTISSYLDKSMAVFSRAKDLTQQLLTFSKGGTPQRQLFELDPIIRESASFALSGSKIGCEYDIDKDLWLANFDKNQIGQVIDNLVINAQQAMPMGGKIVISARNIVLKEGENLLLKAGMFIKLSITDTGIGIPPNLLKRIFDPFFTTKQKGHGLGLTTSYAILLKHDGCIEVESVMGKGSSFHLFLPASHQKTAQCVPQTLDSHEGSGRILIMDDEPSIREILGISLKRMGYTILVAKDGEEALRICAEARSKGEPIDGAFFDLTIPGGMGGKETIAQIRQQYPNLPVFATSGYSEDPIMAKPAEHGFTDSIRKPYRKDELIAMLKRHTLKDSPGDKLP